MFFKKKEEVLLVIAFVQDNYINKGGSYEETGSIFERNTIKAQ